MNFLPDALYKEIEVSVPIVCTDFVLARRDSGERVVEIGLIERESPYGRVWCHLGGRVLRGESIRDSLLRHARESLSGIDLAIEPDPQPKHVYQWFPDDIAPNERFDFGRDSRKHAIGLSYVIDFIGEPAVVENGEALNIGFYGTNSLPERLWPGCSDLFVKLLHSY